MNDAGKLERSSRARRGKKSSARTGVFKPTFRKYLEALGWVFVPTDRGVPRVEGGRVIRLRVGEVQASAVEVLLLDVAHVEYAALTGEPAFPGRLEGSVLVVEREHRDEAWRQLVDAANGCDDEGDREWRDALSALASRVLRAT
jgi:hypothetical protein